MSVIAPGGTGRETHPPVIHHTPLPGATTTRPTVRTRPWIVPQGVRAAARGFPAHSPYVRRFWTAAIGPSAVADLLRLMAAAETSSPIPLPRRLPVLLALGLIGRIDNTLLVPDQVPVLPDHLIRRLPARLRRSHSAWARAAGRFDDAA